MSELLRSVFGKGEERVGVGGCFADPARVPTTARLDAAPCY